MVTYKVGYFVGSLSSTSINRELSRVLAKVAPNNLELTEIPIGDLPLYSPDFDADYPAEGRALKDAIAASDAVLFVTPEYNRSIPGVLKNALDWAHAGPSSLEGMPVAIAGAAEPGAGHFVTLQHLRTVLSDAGAQVMGQPERTLTVDTARFGTTGLCVDHDLEGRAADLMSAAAGYAAFAAASRPTRVPPTSVKADDAAADTTDALDPVTAVRQAAAAGPGPSSPVDGLRTPFLTALATVDPLVETGDPLFATLSSETVTGS